MKAALVTGGCGFIGSFFAEHLLKKHPEIQLVILDAMYDCASMKNVEAIQRLPTVKIVKGAIQNKDLLTELFQTYQFDTIAHFAAQTHVDNSFHSPLQFTIDNVLGIHTLLEVTREFGTVTRFLHISTDEVYGSTSEDKPNTVESLLEPSNPYAATKAAAEMLVKSYIQSFQLPAFIVRMNNVYGPRQYPEKMIPKFLLAAKEGHAIEIQGTGQQKRSMLYVEDSAEAIYTVLMNAEVNCIYNIPSKDEFSVLEVSERVLKLTESSSRIQFGKDRPFNDTRYWIHDETLQKFGWSQRTSFEEGLKKTKDWYYSIEPSTYWKTK
jgi:UDP-glucose 4,6-dehydratase